MSEIPSPTQTESIDLSKRRLLLKIKNLVPNFSVVDVEEIKSPIRPSQVVTRRELLKTGLVFAASIATDQLVDRSFIQPSLEDDKASDSKPNLSLLDTSFQTLLMFGAEAGSVAVAKKIGIDVGNSGVSLERIKALLKTPKSSAFRVTLKAGIYEETLCRLLPNLIFASNRKGYAWDVGIPSAVVFAALHNLSLNKAEKSISLVKGRWPIPQFIGGLFLHKIFREKNYFHSVFAHSLHNAIPTASVAAGYALYNTLPEKAKEEYRGKIGEIFDKTEKQ